MFGALVAVRVLAVEGPTLGRPLVDTIEGSRHANMKELPIEGQTTMSMKDWEKKVLAEPGAADRVAEIEDELRLAAGLTMLREEVGLSQRELAHRLGVTQPRVAAIERSRNVTIEVLEQYVEAVGGQLELTVRKGNRKIHLLAPRPARASTAKAPRSAKSDASA